MAGEPRTPSDPVNGLAGMAAEPWNHDFFQALRRLECAAPQLPRLGRSRRLADDPLRLGQRPECTFAPSTLAGVEPGRDGAPPRLEQFFFGLGGPNGPLPLHLTEYARERQRNHGDATFKRFLDLFHHRLLCLFYRAWAESRPTVGHDRPADDYWAARLAALCGRGLPSLRGRGPLEDRERLHFSGHLAAQTRYPDGLVAILALHFELPVALEEFAGRWLALPGGSRLGLSAATLGADLCLGRHVWDRQHGFRLCLGPLDLTEYRRLLPGGDHWRELAAWIAEYQGEELDWEVELVLRRDQVPPLRLDGALRLGLDSWLGAPPQDAADLRLSSHYAGAAGAVPRPEEACA